MKNSKIFFKEGTLETKKKTIKFIDFYNCTEKGGTQFLFRRLRPTRSEKDYFRSGRYLYELYNYHQRNYRVRKTIEHILLVLNEREREYAAAIGFTPKVIRSRRKEAFDFELCS